MLLGLRESAVIVSGEDWTPAAAFRPAQYMLHDARRGHNANGKRAANSPNIEGMRIRILVCPFVAAVCIAFCAQAARAQKLVYMVSYSYGSAQARLHAQFPSGIFGTTPEQRVAMTRQTLKNEIWSISLRDGKRTLLFSDENMGFEISPAIGGYAVDSSRNVAYVRAVERTWEAPPTRATPGVYETPKGVYEIALDGSNHFRRLFDATQNMSAALVNAAGTRAAFWGWEDKGGYFLYLRELPSGNLLTRVNITKVLKAHCGDCLPEDVGWLADGKRLFFTMEEGEDDSADTDDDTTSAAAEPTGTPAAKQAPLDVTGTRIISEQGEDLGSFPPHAGEMHSPDYKREISITPYLVGETPNGTYVFRDYGEKNGPQPQAPAVLDGILVFTGADFKPHKQIPLGKRFGSAFALAPDGNLLAFVEDRQLSDYKTERHIWARNLQTGEEKELLVVPPFNPPNSPLLNERAVILGWLEK